MSYIYNLYTLSWSSYLTFESKADICNFITRVGMGWAKLKPSLELEGGNSNVCLKASKIFKCPHSNYHLFFTYLSLSSEMEFFSEKKASFETSICFTRYQMFLIWKLQLYDLFSDLLKLVQLVLLAIEQLNIFLLQMVQSFEQLQSFSNFPSKVLFTFSC